MRRALTRNCSELLGTKKRRADLYEVNSVRKALELLKCFSVNTPEWPLSGLSRRLDIPKSTAHNLLRTLQVFDLVRQDSVSRVYRLGPRALELGLLFARNTEILAPARVVLRRIAMETRETVKFGVLSNEEVLIVAAVESVQQLHTRADVGTRWPLHSTSLGKAMLSALPPAEVREIMERAGMPRHTKHTITAWPDMERELKRIHSRRYACDLEENEPGVRCVAVPLSDPLRGLIAALSVSGPSVRINAKLKSPVWSWRGPANWPRPSD
jgi:IclR family KDG regulon transcriptional repressor